MSNLEEVKHVVATLSSGEKVTLDGSRPVFLCKNIFDISSLESVDKINQCENILSRGTDVSSSFVGDPSEIVAAVFDQVCNKNAYPDYNQKHLFRYVAGNLASALEPAVFNAFQFALEQEYNRRMKDPVPNESYSTHLGGVVI